MARATIDLSSKDSEFIEEEIAAGRCRTPSELIARALTEYRRAQALDELDRLVDEADESGEAIEITPEFWAKRRKQILERKRTAAQ